MKFHTAVNVLLVYLPCTLLFSLCLQHRITFYSKQSPETLQQLTHYIAVFDVDLFIYNYVNKKEMYIEGTVTLVLMSTGAILVYVQKQLWCYEKLQVRKLHSIFS